VACWAALAVTALLLGLSLESAVRGRAFLGHQPGGDYMAFYVAGQILNEYPHARVYDVDLQYRLEHALLPMMPGDIVEKYLNAPFLALLFRPLARIPFLWSYGVWMAFSAALYLAGLALLWPREKNFQGVSRIAFLACCSFSPFAIECLVGGQLSALGFFALAACTRWRQSGHLMAAGAALALCLYKPPLLVLAVPMLAIGRRFRTLVGFAAGACVLGALSLAAVGFDGCVAWVQALRLHAAFTAQNPSPLTLFKFVDIHTFFRLLFGGDSAFSAGVALVLAGAAAVYLAMRWARSQPGTQADGLLWAATIAWTLAFNLYVPIYDTVLIVISALLMAGSLYGSQGERAEADRSTFLGWMLVLFVAAWVSQPLASYARVQVLTPVLVVVGALALRFSRRSETALP